MNTQLQTRMQTRWQILGLHAFSDNYIWLLRQAGNAVVVDPGDAAPVFEHLQASGDRLTAILTTHRHPDHVGGITALRERFDVPVFGPACEEIPLRTHDLQGGESIAVPGLDIHFDVLDVGGHTKGHIAYYHPKILLCGDALFVLGCGRLFDGTIGQMAQSIARIAALPRDTQVYCAHEYAHYNLPFALAVEPGNALLQQRALALRHSIATHQPTVPMLLGDELDTNPFLRCHVAEVIAAAQSFSGRTPLNESDTFAALREWRNNF